MQAILERKLNDTTYERLAGSARDYERRLKDVRNVLWDKSRPQVANARSLTANVESRLGALQQTLTEVNALDERLRGVVENATGVVEHVKERVGSVNELYKTLNDDSLVALRDARERLLAAAPVESQSEPRARELARAGEHSKTLEHQARRLETLLVETQRLDAVKAASAYAEIVDAIGLQNAHHIVAASRALVCFQVTRRASSSKRANAQTRLAVSSTRQPPTRPSVG